MLSVNSYPAKYVKDCRSRFEAHVAAFRTLRRAVPEGKLKAFEVHYFNNLLLALDAHFAHRARGQEKKDGNPLNEVRMLCASLTGNRGALAADTTIKYVQSASVLKLKIGAEVRLTEEAFVPLMEAFFGDLEAKFV